MTRNSTKTVAALLTPSAPGAIAVIGLAGPGALVVLDSVARPHGSRTAGERIALHPTLCRFADDQDIIDDALVLLSSDEPAPVIELHVHGGVRISQRVLMALEKRGAAIVDSDAFPDALQSNDCATRTIDAALRNAGSRRLAEWLLAQRSILLKYLQRLDSLDKRERNAFDARSAVASRLVRGMTVVLIGPPNAGKSTLANRLIGRDRVITSDIPGTTRDWVGETALLDGWPVTLIDTAGIRETTCAIEAEAVRRGTEQAMRADLALLVLDSTKNIDEMSSLIEEIKESLPNELPVIVTLNKMDMVGANARPADDNEVCSISALSGAGIAELEQAACRALGLNLLESMLPAAFFSIERESRS